MSTTQHPIPRASHRGRGRHPRLSDALAWVLMAGCFAAAVCAAATRPVVHDEAMTWNRFVSGGLGAIFDPQIFDTNNHVLHSILCLGSTRLLGPTPLGLRLPALLGTLVYLLIMRRICRRLLGPRPLMVAALALLALNPVIFSHFSLARGYSLALAFFALACWQFLEVLTRVSPARPPWAMKPRLLAASLFMGLSIAAQPYFVYANSALAGAFLPLAAIAAGAHRRRSGRAVAALMSLACLPGAALVWLVYRGLRSAMRVVGFNYVGSRSLAGSLRDLAEEMLGAKMPVRGILVSPSEPAPVVAAAEVVVLVLSGAAFCFLLWRLWAMWRRAGPPRSRLDRALGLAGGALGLTLTLHLLAFRIWGTNYPIARLAMPLVVLCVLTLACAARHPLLRRRPWRAITAGLTAAAFALAGWQLWLDRPGAGFCYEADVPQILCVLEQVRGGAGRAPLRVDADWVLSPSIRFYWKTRGLEMIGELFENNNYRVYPAGETPLLADYDAYIGPDRARLEAAGLRVVYASPRSGACVAVPRRQESGRQLKFRELR